MKLSDLIESSYLQYTKKLSSTMPNNQSYKIVPTVTEYDEKIITLSTKNNSILVAHYDIVGTYNDVLGIYYWASSFELLAKSKIFAAMKEYKKILKKHIIDRTYDDEDYVEKIYYYISNPIIGINKENLDILVKLVIFVTKYMGVVIEKLTDSQQVLYVITDVIRTSVQLEKKETN